jgi:class 3 adenylate cyclase
MANNETGNKMISPIRTVSADPGLLSHEQLLASYEGRRRTLEELISKEKSNRSKSPKDHISQFMKRVRKQVLWFIDHARIRMSYGDFMMAVTIFVLFGDDVRIICFPPSADGVFAFFISLSFILFVLEMVLYFWAKSDFSKGILRTKGYAFSFFFWLDLLAVLSMVPDVDWLASALGLHGSLMDSLGTKAGKAGKIGAKSSRVIRMARLVRLVKLYKVTSQRSREKQQLEDLKKLVESGHFSHDEIQEYLEKSSAQKQSKVGAELSDIITRRVIIAVLLMLCIVPLLTYSSPVDDELESMLFLHETNIHAGTDCDYLERSVNQFRSFMGQLVGRVGYSDDKPLIVSLEVHPPRCESINFIYERLSELRKEALRTISTDPVSKGGSDYLVTVTFNLTSFLERESLSSVYLMIFVLFMLVLLSTQFTGDAQRLVLAPIENMMAIVNMVAEDPLEDFDFKSLPRTGDYETHVVQVAIEKITALLRIGFGVAGAEIISSNMAVEGGGNASLNPMIPGKRVYALFGFCDILSFDLCTEKLEDEIMTFVNSIARIVHDEVTRWGGTCNKNLGNAFLMVWRIGDEATLAEYRGVGRRASDRSTGSDGPDHHRVPRKVIKRGDIDLRRIPGLDILSDKALVGFLKVVVEINRDLQLLAYRSDPRLCGENNVNGSFVLRMGFGLHAGWAIEGAVGSLQKVDATYLSPHVNMAARMEAATRQLGVAILITRSFFKLLSETAQQHCRKVDVVTVKGSNVPTHIYTYDTFQNQVFPQLRAPKYSNLTLEDILSRQAQNYDASTWSSDPDLIQLRCLATPQFRKTFENGLNNYLTGHWEAAREQLEKADKMMAPNDIGGDGPSQAILKYMKEYDWVCPSAWEGHRPLTSK